MKISVVITNWNGLNLITKSLPEVLKYSQEAYEFIFVDDGSTDNSLSFVNNLAKKNKKIKIIAQKQNKGFIHSSNEGVSKSSGELVVLLNNDIYPKRNYIKESLSHFQDKTVYGVGFAEIGQENWPRLFWSEGYLQYEPVFSTSTHITGWLSGGSSIVRKEYFQKLKGFDPVYEPFYSEDLDLGYRAWKSGYKLLWEPLCRVLHQHESTTSKFNKHFTDYVKERNRLLVVWRNITDVDLRASNTRGIIFRTLLGPNYIKIIRSAKRQLGSYPPATVFPLLTDRQIFSLFSK